MGGAEGGGRKRHVVIKFQQNWPIFGFPFSQSSRSGHPPFIYALGHIFPLQTTERFLIYGFKIFKGTV